MNEPGSDVLKFWGKARKDEREGGAAYHPVAFHMLDVAACLQVILEAQPVTRARAAALLGVSEPVAVSLLVTFVALHDIGKFGVAFQAKVPKLWPVILGEFKPVATSVHTSDGYLLWDQILASDVIKSVWPNGSVVMRELAPSVFGHHGRPVSLPKSIATRVVGPRSVEAAKVCTSALIRLLCSDPIECSIDPNLDRLRIASWWVAGLITLADWIGSHEEWFPYTIPDPSVDLATTLDSYWVLAKERAAHAVRCAGLYAAPLARSKSFSSLTGIAHPSPAQEWAEGVRIPETPALFILEDVTGSGKTEAAQMLVHRLLCAGKGSGAYWAMPTQATANAMYFRQSDAIAALFADDSSTRPSLALAHGQARLNARFQKSVLNNTVGSAVTDMMDAADSELTSGAACAAFLADDRRTSLLADIGAGTIDQAILGVLPTRFNALRLFALSEKILLIDEAHAYDAYVSKELEVLLQFHSSLGGSAIVLSATLAKSQREALIHAWLRGSSKYSPDKVTLSMSYPLATVVARNTNVVEETPLDAAPRVRRSVAVRFVHSENSIIEEILRGQEIGATVAWVRNSVGDCLDAARKLREKGLDPIVFHARFAQCDRQAREQEILHLFGPEQKGDGPKKIVIATQVIEQSLDISFEMMFSDVAPIDLLIQRAGRLQRHKARGSGRRRSDPELVVLAPMMTEDPPADWLKGLLPATAYIYDNTGVIWRTVRALVQTGRICSPGTAGAAASIRALIEAVYGDDYTPEHLEPITIKAEGKEKAARATANYSTLVPRDGYNAISAGWVNDVHASTRLGLEKTVIRLAMVQPNGSIAPWAGVVGSDDPGWKQWALSEVRISKHFIPPDVMTDSAYDGAIAAARKKWGKYEQEIPVLPLEIGADGVAAGEFRSRSNMERVIRVLYTADDGLSIA